MDSRTKETLVPNGCRTQFSSLAGDESYQRAIVPGYFGFFGYSFTYREAAIVLIRGHYLLGNGQTRRWPTVN